MTDEPTAQRCFICGEDNQQALHEHHIRPRAAGGSDQPENTTWLCANCHQAVHRLYDTNELADRIGVGDDRGDPGGKKIEPRNSIDRTIPKTSPHVTFEPYCLEVGLWNIEKYRDHWNDIPKWDALDSEHLKNRGDYIAEVCDEHADKVCAKFTERERTVRRADGTESTNRPEEYVVIPENKVKNPVVIIVEAAEFSWTDHHQRIHCGYCHRVFSGYNHSDAAKHLRRRHGIPNVYDYDKPEHEILDPLSERSGVEVEEQDLDIESGDKLW